MKRPTEMLAEIGVTLYGARWRLALARALDIDDDTIRRWMSGRTPLPPDHAVFADARRLLRRRQREIGAIADQMDRWIKMPSRP